MHWFCNNKFSELTIVKIAINLINILKRIHGCGIIHRDIKPGSICFGYISKNDNKLEKSLYIIDFGLDKKYDPGGIRDSNAKKI